MSLVVVIFQDELEKVLYVGYVFSRVIVVIDRDGTRTNLLRDVGFVGNGIVMNILA